ncbi:MAG: M28 family metallopeptidase [Kofleriaceae bacterium]
MTARWLVMLSAAIFGCDSQSAAKLIDAAPLVDASICIPFGACDWLDHYQRTIVGTLAGHHDILPGTRLAHRASVEERDAARTYLIDELTALGLTVSRHEYGTGANVVAMLPSTTGTGDLVVMGAHFDSVPAGPGAADNATGVAIVLAAARYLRDLPVRQHPVAFVLFDEEEIGLIGSKAYAAALMSAATPVAAVHNFDMLSFDGDGDRAVELWSPAPELATLYEQHGAAGGMPIQSVVFKYSDHQAFIEAGFVALGVGEEFVADDHTPHYHKATDTYEQVSFPYLAEVTHLALAVVEDQLTP